MFGLLLCITYVGIRNKLLTEWVSTQRPDIWAVGLSTMEFVGSHIYFSVNEREFLEKQTPYAPVVCML